MFKMKNLFQKLKITTLKNIIVQEAPHELAACEECRVTECSDSEWCNCKNRIKLMNRLEGFEKV